jgi:hypothetical protein
MLMLFAPAVVPAKFDGEVGVSVSGGWAPSRALS